MAGDPFRVPVDGGELAAERWAGPAPTVVLLHAGVADRRSWHGVAGKLDGRFDLVAYDRRAFGETEPATRPFTHAQDLLTVLDAVSPGPVWLVGSSAGGGVALAATLLAPGRVAGLVLLAPGGLGGAPTEDQDPETDRLDQLLEAATDPAEVNRLEAWLWLDGPTSAEGRVGGPARALALDMNAIPLAHGVPEDAGAADIDPWARRAELTLPVVLACGDLDVPWLVQRGRLFAESLPNARYVEWPGVAHLPYLEDAGLVAGLIEATVGGTSPG